VYLKVYLCHDYYPRQKLELEIPGELALNEIVYISSDPVFHDVESKTSLHCGSVDGDGTIISCSTLKESVFDMVVLQSVWLRLPRIILVSTRIMVVWFLMVKSENDVGIVYVVS